MVQAFAKQLFEAVAFMHREGYTHTDLKPENILLRDNGLTRVGQSRVMLPLSTEVKIIDFGGATHRIDKHSSVINTR